jgi:hypothetical protein
VELWEAARRAFTLANAKRLAVRSVALTLDRIVEAEAQLELWGVGGTAVGRYGGTGSETAASPRADAASVAQQSDAVTTPEAIVPPYRPTAVPPLQAALDRIRARYGTRAIGITVRR